MRMPLVALLLAFGAALAVFAQISSFGLLWLVLRDVRSALVPWCGMRLIAGYIHVVQNYWTHEPRFGTRRYQDPDNAMNILGQDGFFDLFPIKFTLRKREIELMAGGRSKA